MNKTTLFLIVLGLLVTVGCVKDSAELNSVQSNELLNEQVPNQAKNAHSAVTQKVGLFPFLPAGEEGGADNQLIPGTFFPPTKKSHAKLLRGNDFIQFQIHTTGLPPGAYTVWYIIFNNPDICTTPNPAGGVCNEPDFFGVETAVVWATGGIVQANGIGNFGDRIEVGEQRDQLVIQGDDLTSPLANPKGAEVHLIVKYHGLASDDPDVLYSQTHTLFGNCGENDGANSFDAGPFGIQCFDPQVAVFPAPN